VIEVAGLIPWLTMAALALGIGNSIWAVMTRGAVQTAGEVAEHDRTLVDHDRRIQAVEGEIKHMPSKDKITELLVSLTEVRGKLEAFDSELSSVNRTVNRIEDYLRSRQ